MCGGSFPYILKKKKRYPLSFSTFGIVLPCFQPVGRSTKTFVLLDPPHSVFLVPKHLDFGLRYWFFKSKSTGLLNENSCLSRLTLSGPEIYNAYGHDGLS